MMTTGLVSVTFRKLAPREIVQFVRQAGLHGVEWGGDVHVPHGDVQVAREVRKLTEDAGLRVIAYGSYFRFRQKDSFEAVLDTAVALGAPLIRVWAGDRGSAEADSSYRAHIAAESQRIAQLATQAGVTVTYEFHSNTLTDITEATLSLLRATPGVKTLWQPPHDISEEERLRGLRAVLPWLASVHVFHWQMPSRKRRPLSDGADILRERLKLIAANQRHCTALPEFVRDDDPQQFLQDAETLKMLLRETT